MPSHWIPARLSGSPHKNRRGGVGVGKSGAKWVWYSRWRSPELCGCYHTHTTAPAICLQGRDAAVVKQSQEANGAWLSRCCNCSSWTTRRRYSDSILAASLAAILWGDVDPEQAKGSCYLGHCTCTHLLEASDMQIPLPSLFRGFCMEWRRSVATAIEKLLFQI